MKTKLFLTTVLVFVSLYSFAQGGWTLCNTPLFNNRVDDIFMVNTQTGYAVCGDGQIVKTTDGGNNWVTINTDTNLYCRSVEFINAQKGFVGGFPLDLDSATHTNNILRRTTDGGASWTDLTPLIDSSARAGICGLAIPDSNTIYGCGNWFQDSAYIVKSIDGGNTWSFIDMHTYATHLIDMYFINKDTGFATGSGLPPFYRAMILYTMDGGQSWTYQFQDTLVLSWDGYCWKIQHLTDQVYFASIQGWTSSGGRILKSTDGGMNWNYLSVPNPAMGGNGIQGVGFIDSLNGWTGGGFTHSFETHDGGITWDTIHTCIALNRFFKVNDTLVFVSGDGIWKHGASPTGIAPAAAVMTPHASINCYPNPANKNLSIDLTLLKSTRAMIVLFDETGKRVKVIDNTNKPKGVYKYQLETENLSEGIYNIVLKTHEDDQLVKVVVTH